MAYEVTATRKRPQQFESLAGQDFVVSTLQNAIKQKRIAHAYLFSGPRGVGKTTSARLLAKALNCVDGPTATPCGKCTQCKAIANGNSMDVIEIDGASNTSVNDIRAIKEEVLFPPTSARYKIYIIDEVHMLSTSAFNALLKTIEEPPEYIIFIFATTETQKVPATIRSRCQQFHFQLLPFETIIKLLKQASNEMGIQAEEKALFWIAKESTGSMRDAYTLFDQVVSFSNGNITFEGIKEKLGIIGMEAIDQTMEKIVQGTDDAGIVFIQSMLEKGISVEQSIKDFTDYFRTVLLIKKGIKNEAVLGSSINSFSKDVINYYNEEQIEAALELFLDLYRNVKYSLNPRFELELAISRLSELQYIASPSMVLRQLAVLKNDIINGKTRPVDDSIKKIIPVRPLDTTEKKNDFEIKKPIEKEEIKIIEKEEEPIKKTPIKKNGKIDKESIVSIAKENMLISNLQNGIESVEDEVNNLKIGLSSKMLLDRANQNISSIRDIFSKNLNFDGNISFFLCQKEKKSVSSFQEKIIKEEPIVSAPIAVSPITIDETKGIKNSTIINLFKGKVIEE